MIGSAGEAFLKKYGLGPLKHEGRLYDSKALVAAAVGFQIPARGPLRSTEFSGGDLTVGAKLEELGFEVVTPTLAPLPSVPNVWMVKAGRGDIHADVLLPENVAAVEWHELPDLVDISRPEDLEALLSDAYPERAASTRTRERNELFAFLREIGADALVVVPEPGGRFSLGRETGPYQHRPDLPARLLPKRRKVAWLVAVRGAHRAS